MCLRVGYVYYLRISPFFLPEADEAVDSRRILSWEMVDGPTNVEAFLVTVGDQGSDSKEGMAGIPGCASLRSSRQWVISLSAVRKWNLRGVDVRNALFQADHVTRGAYFGRLLNGIPYGESRSARVRHRLMLCALLQRVPRIILHWYLLRERGTRHACGP